MGYLSQEEREPLKKYIGEYKFISRYFGKIPFNITGVGINSEFPFEGNTFEYKGRRRKRVFGSWQESVIRKWIAEGTLIK